MTTIIVHGTLATNASWYQSSWSEGGFLNGLSTGMHAAAGWDDIWSVNDTPVYDIPKLGDCFSWNGLPEGLYRGLAAVDLAKYLNKIAKMTNEGIRIIAHSHGCNVVKLASSLDRLSSNVFIEKAVFLACPHFTEQRYAHDELSWLDQFDIKKVHKSYRASDSFPYQLDPDRFGDILNVFSERDSVQTDLAESFSGGQTALTGRFGENISKMLRDGLFELAEASRMDEDPDAQHLYQNVKVQVEPGCSGIRAHTVLHGNTMGTLAGVWLNENMTIGEMLEIASPPMISSSDDGS